MTSDPELDARALADKNSTKKWFWMMDYCKKHGLAPAQKAAWDYAETKRQEALTPNAESEANMIPTPPPPPLTPAAPTIALDPSQQRAVADMQSGQNVFLTGEAGCGKTTTVLAFLADARRRVDCTASTGIAALNLRDHYQARSGLVIPVSTIYRFAGIQLGPQGSESDEDTLRRLQKDMRPSRAKAFDRVRTCKTLVLDEVSMIPGRVFGFLEYLFRTLRAVDRPWGGVQVIAVGDMLQLPPVSKSGIYDWCFLSPAWGATGFRNAVLKTIHRQDDPQFIGLLNAVRVGRIGVGHQRLLATRVARFPKADLLRLMTHRTMVNAFNKSRLEAIDGPPAQFLMSSDAGPELDWLKKSLLCPEILEIKAGARIRITKNMTDEAGALIAVNGALGSVLEWDSDTITVKLDGGKVLDISRFTWRSDTDTKGTGPGITQFPLVLSFASTIHACQGLSLDAALIDVRAARDPGQAYVSLSRVRTLSGLWLKDIFQGVFISPQAVAFMRELK